MLHTLRYDDSKLVVRIFTLSSGMKSYVVRPSRKGTPGAGLVWFQPLSRLSFEAGGARGSAMETLRHVSLLSSPLLVAPGMVRGSIALFLADLLNQTIRHQEADVRLYSLIVEGLDYLLSAPEEALPDLPLAFMVRQATVLGFEPFLNHGEQLPFFDMVEGRFVEMAMHGHYIPPEWSALFARVVSDCRDTFAPLTLPIGARAQLLAFIAEYFRLHIPGMEELKSVGVLREVMSV